MPGCLRRGLRPVSDFRADRCGTYGPASEFVGLWCLRSGHDDAREASPPRVAVMQLPRCQRLCPEPGYGLELGPTRDLFIAPDRRAPRLTQTSAAYRSSRCSAAAHTPRRRSHHGHTARRVPAAGSADAVGAGPGAAKAACCSGVNPSYCALTAPICSCNRLCLACKSARTAPACSAGPMSTRWGMSGRVGAKRADVAIPNCRTALTAASVARPASRRTSISSQRRAQFDHREHFHWDPPGPDAAAGNKVSGGPGE
ncbi:hypothetical protein MCHLDSM_04778 [Mycolicibacterium chlorophenolicum]|uniref:Uncharacterized protein n=1 Tax=Mycolicibacterium chlorophenolicum TaxID=37916 RepID=A0A0J6VLG6_9MYCO|nr:hypothetical protein MCHLDSM_04778 [Mycolicibacterium chlorophenolicum]